MIKVTLINNVGPTEVLARETDTIRDVLESEHVDYSRGYMSIDGSPLRPGDMDKTFSELGIETKCFLANVAKTNNA